jgi:drug/metabolite transporter (DMT)-like permease
MNKTEILGLLIAFFGIVVLVFYPLYISIQETEIPVEIRVGTLALVIGFLIIIMALVRERIIDYRTEQEDKKSRGVKK